MDIKAQQVAVITGAGSGIGAALADRCARLGMRIVAADIERDAAQRTADRLKKNGALAIAVEVDVARSDSVKALADISWQTFGGCHLLCNNAGVSVQRPLAECSEADWNWILSVNVLGIANAISAFVPAMQQQRQPAHIVNTASMAGLIPLPDFGPYVASKYAVVGLSEVLQQELAADGIGVSILCPGVVDTRIHESDRNRHDGPTLTNEKTTDGMQTDFDEAFTRVLSPAEVASITLRAVRENLLYVPTHPEWLPLVSQRTHSLHNAFGPAANTAPINQ